MESAFKISESYIKNKLCFDVMEVKMIQQLFF